MAVEGPFDPTVIVVETKTINDFHIKKELEKFRHSKESQKLIWEDFVKFEVTDKENQEFKSACQYQKGSNNNYYLFRKETHKDGELDGHQMQSIYDATYEDGRKDSYYINGKCQAEHTTYFKDGIEIKRTLNKNEHEHGIQTSYSIKGKKTVAVLDDGEKDKNLSKKINQKMKYIRFGDNLRFLFSEDHMTPQDRYQQQVRKASMNLNLS